MKNLSPKFLKLALLSAALKSEVLKFSDLKKDQKVKVTGTAKVEILN